MILAEYKGDNTYLVSCEKTQINEDDFKDKFPYTLDVIVPEQVIRPPSAQSQSSITSGASKPTPKQKTSKDF